MSRVGSLDRDGPHLPSRARQFLAIMLKNVLLQIRSKVICGVRISGVWSVLFDIGIPVIFIAIMCFVRQLPDVNTPPRVFKEMALRDQDWEFPQLGALQPRRCPMVNQLWSARRSCSPQSPTQS